MGVQNKTTLNIFMEEETSEETAAPSFTPVAELAKTALELSTVKKVQSEKKGRQRLECLFCGAQYTGGPSDIRLHLGFHGSGTGGKKCGCFHGKPVKSEMKKRKVEVTDELNRRAKKERADAHDLECSSMPRSSLHAARRDFLLS